MPVGYSRRVGNMSSPAASSQDRVAQAVAAKASFSIFRRFRHGVFRMKNGNPL
ncbi:hypothetical protein [Vineibacter terrae]|uniref:hypothetical protein n=1 Tax=Vineibacter terrae TaxID=2586908 RepID=UPI0015B5DAB4|nr:hypothetical protein [Vineibacter terrae]